MGKEHTLEMEVELKPRKSAADRKPLTICIDAELRQLYMLGKANGHETPDYIRNVVEKALSLKADELRSVKRSG